MFVDFSRGSLKFNLMHEMGVGGGGGGGEARRGGGGGGGGDNKLTSRNLFQRKAREMIP